MSRVYWHAREREVELRGSERAWLAHVAQGPATAAWDLDGASSLERAIEIVSMVPEVPDGEYNANYLHTYMREAKAQDERNKAAYAGWRPGTSHPATDHETIHRFVDSLGVALRVRGVTLDVAGHRLHSSNLDLNTALVAGSDPVRLAAKIHGWCEIHCWVEGPDREWLAGLIDEGLEAGIYRRGLWYSDVPDGPRDKWSSQGWEEVQALLREAADGPVVLSYSVCDQFPNPRTHPAWPGREVESWDDYSDDEKAAVEDWQERWYDNEDDGTRFDLGVSWLREQQPWAQLGPDTLASVSFGPRVTIYDLFAPDRDERISRAFGGER